jgi:hypothetical protein
MSALGGEPRHRRHISNGGQVEWAAKTPLRNSRSTREEGIDMMFDSERIREVAQALIQHTINGVVQTTHVAQEFHAEVTPGVVLAVLDAMEGMRRDAQRYRFLKGSYAFGEWHVRGRKESGGHAFIGVIKAADLDRTIDAAMTRGGGV